MSVRWTNEELAAYERKRGVTERPEAPCSKALVSVRDSRDVTKLNKTERGYLEYLRSLNYSWIGVQCITLKLGDDCRYTPDFWIIHCGLLVAKEVKGFWRDDAKVKIKVAARMYPWILFQVVEKEKNGGWKHTEVRP